MTCETPGMLLSIGAYIMQHMSNSTFDPVQHQAQRDMSNGVLGYLQVISEVLSQLNELLLQPLQLCIPFCNLPFQAMQLLLQKYTRSLYQIPPDMQKMWQQALP